MEVILTCVVNDSPFLDGTEAPYTKVYRFEFDNEAAFDKVVDTLFANVVAGEELVARPKR